MKQKKAQIQNMETITVVIIIIILIIFGLVYAANQRKGDADDIRQTQKELDAMKLTTYTMNMEFVKCSNFEANLETCIDYYKIKALSTQTQKEENQLHFNTIFKETKIELKILKNITGLTDYAGDLIPNENITIYETQNTENRTATLIRTPVTVKDAIKNINYFAIMEVTVYK